MTVSELIAYLQLQPQDAVVVAPRLNDFAGAYMVVGLCEEPRAVQMRSVKSWAGYPLPLESYEIDSTGTGDVVGVILG